jgi:hypothetical protein
MDMSGQFHAPAALPQEKSPRYPLYRRSDGLRSRSGHGDTVTRWRKKSLPFREPKSGRSARKLVTILTELSRLYISIEMISNSSIHLLKENYFIFQFCVSKNLISYYQSRCSSVCQLQPLTLYCVVACSMFIWYDSTWVNFTDYMSFH